MELSLEQQLIDTLKSTIASKDDLIDHLKREIQRLNSIQINLNPPSYPSQPLAPYQPLNPYPFVPNNPGAPYQQPMYPTPPWIVTSGDTKGIIITGDSLPLGSIQSQADNTTKIDYTKITIGDPPGSIGSGGFSMDSNGHIISTFSSANTFKSA